VIVDDADAAARVPEVVDELLADPERLQEMAAAMLAAAKPDAADRIADELVALAAARR
jgi:UDP-N-acetylglucosamine:LPS N-acetylglucosamine transferase